MANLSIANVITVSVSEAQTGLGEYNVNNLALFTGEKPGSSFGDLGYAIYLDPTGVATDFGTDSLTYQMANAVFSQQPNVLAGGGYLAIIPYVTTVQNVAFNHTPTAGQFTLDFDSGTETIVVAYNDTAADINAALGSTTFLTQTVCTGTINSVDGLQFAFYGVYQTGSPAFSVTGNSLTYSGGSSSVVVTAPMVRESETLTAAIARTSGLVEYFGIMDTYRAFTGGFPTYQHDSADVLEVAAAVQAINKVVFFVFSAEADIAPDTGTVDMVRLGGFGKTRCLYYGGEDAVSNTSMLPMQAAYAGRALSVAFDGNNTTQTMHLKDLVGVQPDPLMTQTILNAAVAAGADSYPSIQGVPKVYTSGKNSYFDQVYNLGWFVGALQVATFNYLAQSTTKIPQTEPGMTGLKGAIRGVCQQATFNQYLAPGTWTSSTTFGSQLDFLANVANAGFYIYSQPIALQSQVDRAARKAPLIQIAAKAAGAIQSANLIVYINE